MDDLSGNTDVSSNITMNISTNNSINNSVIENNSASDNNDDDNKTISSIGYQYPDKLLSENNSVDDKTNYTSSLNENYNMKNTQHIDYEDNDLPKEFHFFKFDFLTAKRNNTHVLVESKECKRLLDLKYNDLVSTINRIQTSVIFTSTVSGFMQATKTQFNFGEIVISVISITIATYISLVLSISKYYGLDELKERIQLLREKYSLLLNEVDYNMDKLGPWSFKKQWKTRDPEKKYNEWTTILDDINIKYDEIITTKKDLTSEYEDIMDTKSRNHYHIENKRLNIKNKENVYKWLYKEDELEKKIALDKQKREKYVNIHKLEMNKNSIQLGTEEIDNWSLTSWDNVV
tara:strand:+ start:8465 stop:9505 length:1041 start_codon:yes stop_codon:yes gene_type:complete